MKDTKSALIIFVKSKNFSNVIDKIDEVTMSHPNHVSSKSKTQKNFFNFIISAEDNNDIHIELAVLLFYIPS